ncbi:hypothetical protein [Cellvibrio fibrivorans]|uniref:Uncharacterized protein n=1 Tax=Cellvibrio fibrivorans TaxID=126350 RepID=A0ABU1UYG8_9GAMM|nr:hypothetical protein [Cellvibrio fibrivorans]MDR7090244.1 hypothetical protein [Cellvibrio fibrivorans]
MKFSSVFITIIIIGLASVNTIAQEAQRPGIESFTVGETWEWKEKLVVDVEPNRALMESFETRTVVLDAGEKKFVKKFAGGSKTSAIDQADSKVNEKAFRKWPLKVGAKWEYEESWTSDDGTTGYTRQDVEVVAFEKITVPSGTYSAFKIVHRGTFKNARGSSAMNDVYWYSPEVKANVKHINESGGQTYTSVLVKYTNSSSGQ